MSNNQKTRIIPKDSLFILGSGHYSDYAVHIVAKANQDIDIDVFQRIYREKAKKYDGFDFIDWLEEYNVFTSLKYYDWNIGPCYDSDNMSLGTPLGDLL